MKASAQRPHQSPKETSRDTLGEPYPAEHLFLRPHLPDKPLTKRQQAIEARRIHDAGAAERLAHLIVSVFGGPDEWRQSCPRRQWVKGANGLWHSKSN